MTRVLLATTILLLLAAGTATSHASDRAVITVTTTADEDNGSINPGLGTGTSLREAIAHRLANASADPIVFSLPGGSTITLLSPLPSITGDVSIEGPGADQLTISGNNSRRLFFLDGATLSIDGVRLIDGLARGGNGADNSMALPQGTGGGGAGLGGAILVNSGMLQLSNVTFSGNRAIGGDGGDVNFSTIDYPALGTGGGGTGGSASGMNGGSGFPFPGGMDGRGGTADLTPPSSGSGGFGGGGAGGGFIEPTRHVGTAELSANRGGSSTDPGSGGFGGGGGGESRFGFDEGGSPGQHAGRGGAGRGDAPGSGGGGAGLGGAVFMRAGSLELANVLFEGNMASGGQGGANSVFRRRGHGDDAAAGRGELGAFGESGEGKGAALYVMDGVTISGTGVTYDSNTSSDSGTTTFDNDNVYVPPAEPVGGSLFVTSAEDSRDGAFINGLSLAEAIEAASASPTPVQIQFDAALNGTTITVTEGHLPPIRTTMSIIGNGRNETVITGSEMWRLFHTNNSSINLGISNMTLRDALASGGDGGAGGTYFPQGVRRGGEPVYGGSGGGGAGMGAALYLGANTQAFVSSVDFINNHAAGGSGGQIAGVESSLLASAGGGGSAWQNGGDGTTEAPGDGGGSTGGVFLSSGGAGGFSNAGGFSIHGDDGSHGGGGGGGGGQVMPLMVGNAGDGGFGGGGGGGTNAGAGGQFGGTGGPQSGGGGAGLGGAIFVDAGAGISLANCRLHGNSTSPGGGSPLDPLSEGGMAKGGAVFVRDGGTLSAASSYYYNNTASDGLSSITDNGGYYGPVVAGLASVPVMTSLSRIGPEFSDASLLRWQAVFSEAVMGVDTSDFAAGGTGAPPQERRVISSFSNAISLTNSTHYAQIQGGDPIPQTSFTVEAWVNVRAHNNNQRLFDFGLNNTHNVILALSNGTTGRPRFTIIQNGTARSIDAPSALPLNTWTHVAVSYDRDSDAGFMFVNGAQVATGAMWDPLAAGRNSNFIGRSNTPADARLNGDVDEFRIWNFAKDAGGIRETMFSAFTGEEPGVRTVLDFNRGFGPSNVPGDPLVQFGAYGVVSSGAPSATYEVQVGCQLPNIVQLELIDNNTITSFAGNPLADVDIPVDGSFVGDSCTVGQTPPELLEVIRTGASPTNQKPLTFSALFSEPVTQPDSLDFKARHMGTLGFVATQIALPEGQAICKDTNTDLRNLNATDAGFINGPMTITAWIKPASVIGAQNILSTRDATNNRGFSFRLDSNRLMISLHGATDHAAFYGLVPAGEWSHVAVVIDDNSDVSFYLNGYLADFLPGLDFPRGTNQPYLVIGGEYGGNNFGFTGCLDEVALWERPLSDTEIQSAYREGLVLPEADLLGYWKFDGDFTSEVHGLTLENFLPGATAFSGDKAPHSRYAVELDLGFGEGEVGLNFDDADRVFDRQGIPMGGPGVGNGSFESTDTYYFDSYAPAANSITTASVCPTDQSVHVYTVTFSEPVTGVDPTDFVVETNGLVGAMVTDVSGSDTVWMVTVDSGVGVGTFRLHLVDDDSIIDALGNPLAGAGAGNGNISGPPCERIQLAERLIVVNTTDDENDGIDVGGVSLRDAIAAANADKSPRTVRIEFDLTGRGLQTTLLEHGPMVIDRAVLPGQTDLVIEGPGAGVLELNAQFASQHFILRDGTVELSGFRMIRGRALGATGGSGAAGGGGSLGAGGAIFVDGGSLILRGCEFFNFFVLGGFGGDSDIPTVSADNARRSGGGGAGMNGVDGDSREDTSEATGGDGGDYANYQPGGGGAGGTDFGVSGSPGALTGGGGGGGSKVSGATPSGHGGAGAFGGGGGGGGGNEFAARAGDGGAGGFGAGGGGGGPSTSISQRGIVGSPGMFGGEGRRQTTSSGPGGGGGGGAGLGGAIFVRAGATIDLDQCHFEQCSTARGQDGQGGGTSSPPSNDGLAKGGAIFIMDGATASAGDGLTFTNNFADDAKGNGFVFNTLSDTHDVHGIITGGDLPIQVESIILLDPSPVVLLQSRFRVTFSAPVSNVTMDDFTLSFTDNGFGFLTNVVEETPSQYVVTFQTNFTFSRGGVRLDLNPGTDIVDASMATPPAYTDGPTYWAMGHGEVWQIR